MLALVVAAIPSVYARPSVPENMANGATILAGMKLADSAESGAGHDLLRFALAVDPENRQALLLQAKVERGLKLDPVSLADGGAKYCQFLAKIAARTKSKGRKLLLYKIIEIIQPDNEDVLLALTKAANAGVDISLDALLSPLEKSKKSAGNGDSAPKKRKKEADGGEAKKILERVRLARVYVRPTSPWNTINDLNRATCPEGVAIKLRASKLTYQTSTTSYNGIQMPYYYGNAVARAGAVRQEDLILSDRSAHDVLRALCWMCNLGYTYEGQNVVITNPDDESAVESGGTSVAASSLVAEFEAERAKSIRKYRGKRIAITGPFSGIGKEMRNSYVHIAGDKVKLVMGSDAPQAEITKLEEAGRRTMSDSDFYSYTLWFGTVGICDGLSRGKVVFKNCEDVWWWHVRKRR
ncbi:MAG: hypothetical protein HN742_33870 [Lentisphaerae bacterium]|nr:hypothetical protein [Lentisphaerota bacterium]MBT4815704.1 hypothetical protein [Lentisphaerota bacterium]MBT5611452.1 hypothetical protein [Lentisphaerota bacterium]MBT7059681.1 hypothetical protein [Lentisphaerota bacterium]MBT7846909.1 hypothetical protein [Lentisphaerota bacterium]